MAALAPQDVNDEIEPEKSVEFNGEYRSSTVSPSSDVYEWRKPGVDGCTAMQGCISLISSGGSGRLVMLLGTANEGRNVFFTSAAPLGPNDNDNALDIYDARIDGGEPPAPARPVECEGNACSTPLAAPIDSTPASLVFSGSGNLAPLATPTSSAKSTPKTGKPKKKKTKKKVRPKKGKKGKKASNNRRGR